MSFEYFIGTRYLKAKQKQSFISMITVLSVAGVTVGVMALIVVIAVMSGFEDDMKSRILGVESHLVLMRHGTFSDYQPVIERMEKVAGIEAVTPFIYSQVMLRSSHGVSGSVLRGIDPKSAPTVLKGVDIGALSDQPAGSTQEAQEMHVPGIVLGKELARSLHVLKGDMVQVITTKGMISPIGHVPTMRRFVVKGYFETGMYEYDGAMAYVTLKAAQKLLRMKGAISGIEARVTDIYKAREVAERLVEVLGYPYWVRDWMQMNRNLFSALKLEKTVMFIILALIILVAAFNIASSLIMMVMEKTKDIAILKAMGATDGAIRKIFVFEGMLIGAIGTFLGGGIGFVLCALLEKYKFIELPGDVYYLTTLPVKLDVSDVVVIALAALAICFLATLYPARQASRLDPVEAIRYG
ncbi:MAG: lipoprotein-releasing ABC transporter permease subunit [Deltaproteobacteria bacterium]|nr:lipoprotein-releasing ABC transporter permease subunit [Deltaproteobacteria bacterium]